MNQSKREMDISIIIPCMNVREVVEKNLKQLFSLSDSCEKEIIVITNGSEDGTPRMIRELFPDVSLIINDYNAGFSYACNQGLQIARGKYLLLLNPDMFVLNGVLDHVCQTLQKKKEVGVLGIKLKGEQGEQIKSVRRDPGFWDQIFILLKIPHVWKKTISRYLAEDFDYSVSQDVLHVRGAFFAFRRDVFEKVGLLDERYFVWFEEVDFCRRVREAGYTIFYDAQVESIDLVGREFKKLPLWFKQYHFSRSMALYFQKWHGFFYSIPFWILCPFLTSFGFLLDLYRLKIKKKKV